MADVTDLSKKRKNKTVPPPPPPVPQLRDKFWSTDHSGIAVLRNRVASASPASVKTLVDVLTARLETQEQQLRSWTSLQRSLDKIDLRSYGPLLVAMQDEVTQVTSAHRFLRDGIATIHERARGYAEAAKEQRKALMKECFGGAPDLAASLDASRARIHEAKAVYASRCKEGVELCATMPGSGKEQEKALTRVQKLGKKIRAAEAEYKKSLDVYKHTCQQYNIHMDHLCERMQQFEQDQATGMLQILQKLFEHQRKAETALGQLHEATLAKLARMSGQTHINYLCTLLSGTDQLDAVEFDKWGGVALDAPTRRLLWPDAPDAASLASHDGVDGTLPLNAGDGQSQPSTPAGRQAEPAGVSTGSGKRSIVSRTFKRLMPASWQSKDDGDESLDDADDDAAAAAQVDYEVDEDGFTVIKEEDDGCIDNSFRAAFGENQGYDTDSSDDDNDGTPKPFAFKIQAANRSQSAALSHSEMQAALGSMATTGSRPTIRPRSRRESMQPTPATKPADPFAVAEPSSSSDPFAPASSPANSDAFDVSFDAPASKAPSDADVGPRLSDPFAPLPGEAGGPPLVARGGSIFEQVQENNPFVPASSTALGSLEEQGEEGDEGKNTGTADDEDAQTDATMHSAGGDALIGSCEDILEGSDGEEGQEVETGNGEQGGGSDDHANDQDELAAVINPFVDGGVGPASSKAKADPVFHAVFGTLSPVPGVESPALSPLPAEEVASITGISVAEVQAVEAYIECSVSPTLSHTPEVIDLTPRSSARSTPVVSARSSPTRFRRTSSHSPQQQSTPTSGATPRNSTGSDTAFVSALDTTPAIVEEGLGEESDQDEEGRLGEGSRGGSDDVLPDSADHLDAPEPPVLEDSGPDMDPDEPADSGPDDDLDADDLLGGGDDDDVVPAVQLRPRPAPRARSAPPRRRAPTPQKQSEEGATATSDIVASVADAPQSPLDGDEAGDVMPMPVPSPPRILLRSPSNASEASEVAFSSRRASMSRRASSMAILDDLPTVITLTKTLPATAMVYETVDARYRASFVSKCKVTVRGLIQLKFKAKDLLTLSPDADLAFQIKRGQHLTEIELQYAFVFAEDHATFCLDAQGLSAHVAEHTDLRPDDDVVVDVLRYSLNSIGPSATPLRLRAIWKEEGQALQLKGDFAYNTKLKRPLLDVAFSVAIPRCHEAHLKPEGSWTADTGTAVWNYASISSTQPRTGSGVLYGRFIYPMAEMIRPKEVRVSFECPGALMSGIRLVEAATAPDDASAPAARDDTCDLKLRSVEVCTASGEYAVLPA
eukprot:m.47358 g.47358  ORF g.47358 m.47358 type:complete len:1288 (+) comp11914_c0_seq1:107-3970(+)